MVKVAWELHIVEMKNPQISICIPDVFQPRDSRNDPRKKSMTASMTGTDSKAGGRDYLLLFMQAKSVCERW